MIEVDYNVDFEYYNEKKKKRIVFITYSHPVETSSHEMLRSIDGEQFIVIIDENTGYLSLYKEWNDIMNLSDYIIRIQLDSGMYEAMDCVYSDIGRILISKIIMKCPTCNQYMCVDDHADIGDSIEIRYFCWDCSTQAIILREEISEDEYSF